MSKSKIVKAPFVSMSDIRREIKTVDPKDPKIIPNLEADLTETPKGDLITTEEDNLVVAIDDDVIDGSTSILIEEAKKEAEAIVDEARQKAQMIESNAQEEGYRLGYEEGVLEGNTSVETKILELDQRLEQVNKEYEGKIREIEPVIAEIIGDLVSNMVGHYAENKDVIIFLIRLALSEITTYGSFILKVAPEDFDYVMEHKEALTEGLSDKVEIEVLRDNNLSPKACLIETDYGNVDGSLHLRLSSLTKELKLIGDSMRGNREA